MKHYIILLLLGLLIVSSSCTKKSSDEQQSISSCKLLSMYYDTDSIRVYHYDAAGRLVLKWDLFEQGPYFNSSHYVYQNNKLAYMYRSASDTTFYSYDTQGRLIACERHMYGSGSKQIRLTKYTYNQLSQIVVETDKGISGKSPEGTSVDDSLVYVFENQNIRKIDRFWWYDPSNITHDILEFTYDNGKNFYAATGEPPVSYLSRNLNNLLTAKLNSSLYYSDTIVQYNAAGYPMVLRSGETYKTILTYSCW